MTVDPCYLEEPVLFGRNRSLVGSVCMPVGGPQDSRPFVLFLSSGIIHRAGPNRMYVRIARALASAGITSLRFDLSGIGDSVLPAGAPGMSTQQRAEVDIDDALGFMRERYEVERFVVVGLCSGADHGLRTMARGVDVVGAVLLDLNADRTFGFYVRYYSHRVLRLQAWLNILTGRHPIIRVLRGRIMRSQASGPAGLDGQDAPSLALDSWLPNHLMRDHLERVIAREGKLLCIFTAGLMQYNYRNQFLELFPNLNFRDCLTLEYYADADHTFSSPSLQERLVKVIVDWLSETSFSFPGAE